MKNTIEKILEKIKTDKTKPKAKLWFEVEEILIWFSAGVLIALAALVVATVIFNFSNTDWMLRRKLGWGMGKFIFMNTPYIWLFALLGLTGVAYYTFRQTKKGYHYALPIILGIIILISLIFGWASHSYFMAGRLIEQRATKSMPYYNMITRPQKAIWLNPEKGILAGKIMKSMADNKFELIDFNKKQWTVVCEECLRSPMVKLSQYDLIKISGEKDAESIFIAKEIWPMFDKKTIQKKFERNFR